MINVKVLMKQEFIKCLNHQSNIGLSYQDYNGLKCTTKKNQGTQSNRLFLSPNHHAVLPLCAQALVFIELPVDNVNSQDVKFSLALHNFCQKHAVSKMLRHQKTVTFFNV
jgi:hypothetical protein